MATLTNPMRLLPVQGTPKFAELAIDGPAAATFNTVVQAAPLYEGPIGNTITLALVADGDWVPNVGTFTISTNPTNNAAVLDLAGVSTLDTVVAAKLRGTAGNSLTLSFVADGTGAGELDESAAPALVFHYEDGVTTITNLETALTASTNLAVGTPGTGATVLDVGDDDFAATPLAGGTTETVTIGSTVYTFVFAATSTAYDVEIGATASDTCDNLIAAINAGAGAGTVYGTGTLVHPSVRAFAGASDTVVVHTNADTILTAVGTLIATTETCADCAWGATTLADGTDGTNVAFTVTGTDISCSYSDGYTTVSDFEAAIAADADVAALLRVKTAGTTPLYQLVVTDDDFSATALAGGGATASAIPSSFTDDTLGVAIPFLTDRAVVAVRSVAGSGTMTATIRLWGYMPSAGRWYALGTGASGQGYINGGLAIAEIGTGTDLICQAETLTGLRPFSRLYAEIVGALGGTATEVELLVHCIRASTVSES